jgi:two-component system sensor histidine kinase KdpD
MSWAPRDAGAPPPALSPSALLSFTLMPSAPVRSSGVRHTPLAMVAHDLRQPAAAALMTAEFIDELLDAHASAEVLRQQTALIRGSMRHALRLANDLLTAVQLDSGALQLRRARVDVEPLLHEAVLLVSTHAQAKRIAVTVSVGSLVPPPCADRGRLLQVLTNVLENAVKFTPRGGAIRIDVTSDEHAVEVSVADSGPGLPDGTLALAFERFWQSGHGAALGGAGLGLSIARWLVELHGGTIGATNAPGGGLRIAFTIPHTGREDDPSPRPLGQGVGADGTRDHDARV